MPSFALITEGVSDQTVLRYVIAGVFEDPNIDVRPLQPLRDETGERDAPEYQGGWGKVLEYCASSRFQEAFQTADYVVIQIDTDVSQDYGVPHHADGEPLSDERIIERVRERLTDAIGAEFYATVADRIVFAIAVGSIECWLLPLLYSDNRRAKTTNCLDTLNQAPKRKQARSIDPENKREAARIFEEIIGREFRRRKGVEKCAAHNAGFRAFVGQITPIADAATKQDGDR